MKKFLLSSFVFLSLFVKAQVNLVVNPSFEDYTSCPTWGGQIYKAIGWDVFSGSPDYFNPCGASGLQVPSNSFGYQQAANGISYGGIITYYNGSLAREIMGDSLSSLLVPFEKYYLSFKINRADDTVVVGYSTNKIGAKFSTVKLFPVNINNSAHIYNNSVITDTLNWLRISGSFIADSAYKYLMIGNFFDDINTTVTNQSSGIYAYYYIDEVCLSTDSLFCANYTTSINEFQSTNEILIFPNPADNEVFIQTNISSDMSVYNSLGQNILYSPMSKSTKRVINTSEWKEGLYLININSKAYKLIIHH